MVSRGPPAVTVNRAVSLPASPSWRPVGLSQWVFCDTALKFREPAPGKAGGTTLTALIPQLVIPRLAGSL
ncbi:hypothetical protein MPNT_120016 [Candidatus Methylacidithermus pantelleriae]|uniref:Uncharacterized protein n=1 Tax=Candidatus Methylacidithermus pantelleriae TaxID=2744239 RepID=A0A8J2BN22_9BACT|nr:hypothetical protein MPNT_120016 [Candidatus Methylacidithermus pantelleriae]